MAHPSLMGQAQQACCPLSHPTGGHQGARSGPFERVDSVRKQIGLATQNQDEHVCRVPASVAPHRLMLKTVYRAAMILIRC